MSRTIAPLRRLARVALLAAGAALALVSGCRSASQEGAPRVEPSAPVAVDASSPSGTPAPTASSAPVPAAPAPACEDLVPGDGRAPSYPPGFAVKGLDASTDVAWATARAHGASFAILQATMGREPNKAFAKSWEMARACGIPRGAYQFLSPKVDADAQANLFVDRLSDRGELPPIVDVELAPGCKAPCCDVSCDGWKATVARVLARVEQRMGVRPLVYTVEPFWKECLCNTSRFANHALWLAGYPRFDAAPRPGFGGWQRWMFYQAAGNVRLGRGVIDTDVFAGDRAAFDALLARAQDGGAP